MSNFSMDLHGFNRVENKLRAMAAKMPKMAQEVVYKWAQQTRAILKSTAYPAKNTAKMRWVSDKQRRYVMAAIRRGDITVPYRRTGNLANRWTAARLPDGARIYNTAKYSRYVIGDKIGGGQYWMHKGRWWKARQIINREAPKLTKALAAEIRKEWSK